MGIPLCIVVSNNYPFRNVCVVSIGTIAINGIGHILAAVIMQKYNPGLLTSIFLFAPYCYYTLRKMLQTRFILRRDIGYAMLYGVICHLPLQGMTFVASFRLI